MRTLSRVVIAVVLMLGVRAQAEEGGHFEQVMKLEGKALAEQAEAICQKDPVEFTPAQLCALAEKLFREWPGDDFFDQKNLVFTRACEKGDEDSLTSLVGLFTALSAEEASLERSRLLVPLADLWLSVHTAAWQQAPPTLQFPKGHRGLPREIKMCPPDLQKAWLSWKRATGLVVAPWAVKPDRKSIAYQSEYKQFWSLVDDLLVGRGKEWSARLMRFQWAGWCGTGSEELIVPQSWALVMAFVAEKRIPEAINASFWVVPAPSVFPYDTKYRGLYQLLQNSGFDWQSAIVGGLVNRMAYLPVSDQADESIDVKLLVKYGGEKSARLLLQVARLVSAEDNINLLWAYAQFVTPGSPAGPPTKRYNAEPIPEEIQTGLLQVISKQVVENSRFEVSETLAETLADLRRPETKEALYRLLQHPSEKIARRAEKTLNDLGEKATMPPKLGPVRYQVTVNGQALAEKEVQWHLDTGSCSVSSSSEANAAGIVGIDRDHFFDLKHAVPKVRLYAAEMKDPADLWFNVNVPPPEANDAPIAVKVETKPFDFVVTSPDANPVEIKISKVLAEGRLDSVGTVKAKPGDTPVHFAALPPGEYHLEVLGPEVAPWSGNIDTSKEGLLAASLKKASKICFSLTLPEGWENSEYVRVDLFKDGKRLEGAYAPSSEDSKVRTFQWLSPGHYVLKIPSSKELHKFDPEAFPGQPAFEGLEVVFEITGDSPARINLGELKLKGR